MSGGVFVLRGPQQLVAMRPAQFALEDDFQKLLSDFPELLSGDLVDSDVPRRWVLIAREKSIPSQDGGGARWSVDHLFLDQDGVPTIVEVKRQSDSRLRREVVGQMLDYAANAVVYWPVEELRAEFSRICATRSVEPDEQLRTSLGISDDVEVFWARVKSNLREGRVRLLFVADLISSELRRIVEFLNEQMDPAEVLALELRQYEGEGLKTLVPVVYGQTQEAQLKKGSVASKQWTEDLVLQTVGDRFGAEIQAVAADVLKWMKANSRVWFGRGTKEGSARSNFAMSDREVNLLNLWTYGKVEIAFPAVRGTQFEQSDGPSKFISRLNQVEGLLLPPDAIQRYPSVSLKLLVSGSGRAKFFDALDWLVEELRASSLNPEKPPQR